MARWLDGSMARWLAAGLASCSLLVIVWAPSSDAAVADASKVEAGGVDAVTEIAAAQMVEDYGITMADAIQQIDDQQGQIDLSDQLGRLAGPGWAGSYIDHTAGGRLIALVTDAKTLSAALATDPDLRALSTKYQITQVTHSYAELAHIVDAATQEVSAHGASADGSHVDVESNTAVVEVRPTDSALSAPNDALDAGLTADRVRGDLAARYGTAVRVEMQPGSIEPISCYVQFQECDGPLRGGIYMPQGAAMYPGPAKTACTAGFIVNSNAGGNPLVITAGHCFRTEEGQANLYHTRMPKDGQAHLVGSMVNRQYGPADIGVVTVNNLWGWFPLFSPMNTVLVTACPTYNKLCVGHPTTRDELYSITAAGTVGQLTPQNSYLCATGAMTGTRCGQYQAAGISYGSIHNLAKVLMFSCRGDSGGPVFIGHTGFGIVAANALDAGAYHYVPDVEYAGAYNTECGYTTYYQGIVGGTLAMGVSLRTTP